MNVFNAIAYTQSVDGKVDVIHNNNVITVDTTQFVEVDDNVQVMALGNRLIVVGVIGRGDETQSEIINLQSNQEFIAAMTDVNIWDNTDTNEEYSIVAQVAKRNYDSGLWKIQRINMLLEAKKITDEEYQWIVGENQTTKKSK